MAATTSVQTRIDPALKECAAAVLERKGPTISDAVRILLTRIANEGALPFPSATDPAAHDAWFRAKVLQALDDTRPEAHFAKRGTAALHSAAENEARSSTRSSATSRGITPALQSLSISGSAIWLRCRGWSPHPMHLRRLRGIELGAVAGRDPRIRAGAELSPAPMRGVRAGWA